jgi:iron complex transport system ATP-binding protein
MKPIYSLHGAGVEKSRRAILKSLDLQLFAGEFVCILGPNGAGKSTLLRLLAGMEAPSIGQAHLGTTPIHAMPRLDLARQVALVEPMVNLNFPFSVEQMVYMGRAPHRDRWFESAADLAAAEEALAAMDCLPLRGRDFRTLSSGEKQRVLVASALAQQTCVLLLDEPAAFLDIQHQVDLFRALQRLASQGYLVVAVTHDFNLASAWASRLLLLQDGRLAASGTPRELCDPALIGRVFGLHVEVHNIAGRLVILPEAAPQ